MADPTPQELHTQQKLLEQRLQFFESQTKAQAESQEKALKAQAESQEKALKAQAESQEKAFDRRTGEVRTEFKALLQANQELREAYVEFSKYWVGFQATGWTILLAVLAFFGWKMISRTIRTLVAAEVKRIVEAQAAEAVQKNLPSVIAEVQKNVEAQTTEAVQKNLTPQIEKEVQQRIDAEHLKKTLEEEAQKAVQAAIQPIVQDLEQLKTQGAQSAADLEAKNQKYDILLEELEAQKQNVAANFSKASSENEETSTSQALREFAQVLSQIKPEAKYSAQDWFWKGNAAYDQKEYAQAIEAYTQAIALAPEDAVSYQSRAVTYRELGKYEKALEDYAKALALAPQNADSYTSRSLLYLAQKKFSEAESDLQQAFALQTNNFWSYSRQSLLFLWTQRQSEALKSAQQAKEFARIPREKYLASLLLTVHLRLQHQETQAAEAELASLFQTHLVNYWKMDWRVLKACAQEAPGIATEDRDWIVKLLEDYKPTL